VTPEQQLIYLQAQITCAQIKMQGMLTANIQASISRNKHDHIQLPYQQKDFDDLIEEYGLGHNTIISFMQRS
jgi:hypothetical protein